jgi:hypothetical protein
MKSRRNKNSLTIAVDFDGTVVTHEYPKIGRDIGAIPVLQDIVDSGHRLILLTMRSDRLLEEAVYWFSDNGIKLWAANDNPEQYDWTDSKKVYANMYIDDAALGVPLLNDIPNTRPYVDWEEVRKMLIDK